MAIDPEKAIGESTGETHTTWTARDVILYQLGLGAGADPVSDNDLAYVLEDRVKVLPSYGVPLSADGTRGLHDIPGLEFDHAQMLHGEHEIELAGPLPTEGSITTRGHIAAIHDKGKAAVTVLETVSTYDDGSPAFTNRYSLFMRGAGGFGGDPGPSRSLTSPEGEPTAVVETKTLPQQALIYRLSGDVNPLHADPAFAAKAGFPRPILHGLCTFGIACRAVIDSVLDGDVSRVRAYGARFSGIVFPGETLLTRVWKKDDGAWFDVEIAERGTECLVAGHLEVFV